MRYAEDSILPYDDNKVIHQLLKRDNTISSSTIKDLKIMNDNIIQMSRQLMTNIPININGYPESFTSDITNKILDELNIRPTIEDFQAIKDKGIKLCLVGYGGAMINMLYNMYLWSMELSVTQPFEKIVIFEKDTLDFSNIPRLGKPISSLYYPDFMQYYDDNVKNLKTLPKLALLNQESELCQNRKIIDFQDWLDENAANKIESKNYVFVGAPTLETRNMLSDKNFYFMGHGDHEVEISYRPRVTSGLVVETYGTIDIPTLLVNLQLSTAAFIKHLAGDDKVLDGEAIFKFNMEEYKNQGGLNV
jgi:hypothetical protein